MTAVLPRDEVDIVSALRAEIAQMRAGFAAVIDELAKRQQTSRRNYGFYDPTPAELAAIDVEVHDYWTRFALAAAKQTGGAA